MEIRSSLVLFGFAKRLRRNFNNCFSDTIHEGLITNSIANIVYNWSQLSLDTSENTIQMHTKRMKKWILYALKL